MIANSNAFLSGTNIEVLNQKIERGRIKFAIFDFDGTISLIREGWQQIMIPMMVEILMETPNHESRTEVENVVKTFVANTTGKQTIYQMIRLVEEIKKRGGRAKEPLDYKNQYHDLLMERIISRIEALRRGELQPNDWAVPGALEALKAIKERGVICFLASGTDENYVLDEAELLGVTPYFEGVYGAQDDYQNFSKRMVIQKIITENRLAGPELIGFGDGYVEIEDTKSVGGIAVGVATNEAERVGVDAWKRDRLISSGADLIMGDFTESRALFKYLFLEED